MKAPGPIAVCLCLLFPSFLSAQNTPPPWDLWNDATLAAIRDRRSLELSVTQRVGYADVYFTSNASARWFDEAPPYAAHVGEKIRIHGYLAWPLAGGPYPAVVIGHGHGGRADLPVTQLVASLGYVALYIDGPRAGLSTGGPKDDNQAWISVDQGPEYGFLYHWAYAGMRALTVLEDLASRDGNPYRIDANRFGVLGASMGGIFTTYINAIDDRVKAAIIMASAGNWAHSLRYANAWLYEGIYNGTRDRPYNGSDPLNSIENIDTDPTAITFMNYFDPIRYATRQHAPALFLIGTHDEYFPLPSANLMLQAVRSEGSRPDFEKRLWLAPNAPHAFADTTFDLLRYVAGLTNWLDYCFSFGSKPRPVATPTVAMSQVAGGLRFEITTGDPAARLAGTTALLYAATRVNSVTRPISDFRSFLAIRDGDRFVTLIPPGEKSGSGETLTADNIIYFATITDGTLPVSSLVYKGGAPIDLSTGFVPVIEPHSSTAPLVPLPPPASDAAVSVSSSLPVALDRAYQGISLTNPTAETMAVRVEARTPAGRIAAGEGLINPMAVSLPPRSQKIFLFEQWFGPGARRFDGSFRAGWSDARGTSLAFRGNIGPSELEGIGPAAPAATELWLPLAPEQDGGATRRVRIVSPGAAATVRLTFRSRTGADLLVQQSVPVPAAGTVDVTPPAGTGANEPAMVRIEATQPVSARLEVSGAADPWSIEARRTPTATRYLQPHVEWNGVFRTRFLFVNPSNQPRTLRFALRTPDGSEAAARGQLVLDPNATASRTVEEIFSIGPAGSRGAGWVEINSEGGPVVATALAVDSAAGAAAASAVDDAGGRTWSMPFFVENDGYWTGLALVNPTDQATAATITAFGLSGQVLGQATATLAAGQSRTLLAGQWIRELADGGTGHFVIQAGGPLQLLAYFGTDDYRSLAAIPFQAIP